MVQTTPFEDNGEITDKGFVTIYQLDKGCCDDCSISFEYYRQDVYCRNCGSREYKDIIDYYNYMRQDIKEMDSEKSFYFLAFFCYKNDCMFKYKSKKFSRSYKKDPGYQRCLVTVEDIFNTTWFMREKVYN